MQATFTLLLYIGQNIALFCGGLFTGATLYICLTERPPRTALGFADLLALSRAAPICCWPSWRASPR